MLRRIKKDRSLRFKLRLRKNSFLCAKISSSLRSGAHEKRQNKARPREKRTAKYSVGGDRLEGGERAKSKTILARSHVHVLLLLLLSSSSPDCSWFLSLSTSDLVSFSFWQTFLCPPFFFRSAVSFPVRPSPFFLWASPAPPPCGWRHERRVGVTWWGSRLTDSNCIATVRPR